MGSTAEVMTISALEMALETRQYVFCSLNKYFKDLI